MPDKQSRYDEDRFLIRCDCKKKPVIAEFWRGESEPIERPSIFHFWTPDSSAPRQEYPYGIDACPVCGAGDPIKFDKARGIVQKIWDALENADIRNGVKGIRLISDPNEMPVLSRDLPIFANFERYNEERGFSYFDVKDDNGGYLYHDTFEEEADHSFEPALAVSVSWLRGVLSAGKGGRASWGRAAAGLLRDHSHPSSKMDA